MLSARGTFQLSINVGWKMSKTFGEYHFQSFSLKLIASVTKCNIPREWENRSGVCVCVNSHQCRRGKDL